MAPHPAPVDTITLEVPAEDLDEFRVMLREQIAGDSEQLRWLREHPGCGRRHEDHLAPERLQRRIRLCWRIGDALGGLYLMAVPALLGVATVV